MNRCIHLTSAQASAFECRDWSDEPITRAAWDGDSRLVFDDRDADTLASEITDASNAEDEFAQDMVPCECRTFAKRAARSLACVSGKVLGAGCHD